MLGGHARDRIASGVSIGIQRLARRARRRRWSASSPPAIGASRSRSSRAGTSTPVETVRARFGAIPLMVDANAAYTLGRRGSSRRSSIAFDLMMIEQPLDYDDIARSRRAAAAAADADLPRRVDQDRRHRRARRIAAGACRIINIKPGRVGGFSRVDPAARSLRRARHSGVARRHARDRASAAPPTSICRRCPNFTLPGDIAASKRYFDPGSDRAADRSGRRRHHRACRTAPGIGVVDPRRSDRARPR